MPATDPATDRLLPLPLHVAFEPAVPGPLTRVKPAKARATGAGPGGGAGVGVGAGSLENFRSMSSGAFAADTVPSTSFGPEFQVRVTAAVGAVNDHLAVSELTAD
jgi:hypothetical protein